jgi:tetratricopeptide (TPR) repeat protein
MDIIVSRSKGRDDPSDIKLDDLVERSNYKQALADIEKRLKKSKSDRLLVNKAIVLYRKGDRAQAFQLLEQVIGHDAAWNDRDIFTTLDAFAHTGSCPRSLTEKISALWEKALKTLLGDEPTAAAFFETKFLSHDYQIASQVKTPTLVLL